MRHRWGSVHDRLARVLAPEALVALMREFGGELIRVPTKRRETRAERTARVLELLQSETYTETARQMGVDRATVYRESKRTA